MQNKDYTYAPTVTNPSSAALTFGISGMPTWATFSAATGELTGTPHAADVGVHKNISISVTDGTTTNVLATFDIEVVASGAAGGAVTLSWTPPTRNTDGTPLTDLA